MIITQTTAVSFVSDKEYDEIRDFETRNDMSEWKKSESTVLTTYTRVIYRTITKKERT